MSYKDQIRIAIARYSLEMEACEELHLPPFKGSTFRGAFGNAFKGLVCIQRNMECGECFIRGRCVYAYVFENPLSGESPVLRGETQHTTHPFVIEPPETMDTNIPIGERIKLGLLLYGGGIEYLPFFIFTFQRLGEKGIGKGRGRVKLRQISQLTGNGEAITIYKNDKFCSDLAPRPLYFEDLLWRAEGVQDVQVVFHTPTRIIDRGRFATKVPFSLLMRAIFRRVNQLNLHHCGGVEAINFRDWIYEAKGVQLLSESLRRWNWERYSSRQGQKIRMDGVVGTVIYQDVPARFHPFLRLAQYLHVGKYPTFGMGRVSVRIGEEIINN